jgi:VWFA-related protein
MKKFALYLGVFYLLLSTSTVFSSEQPTFLKSGAAIKNAAASDVLLTFNQIDDSQFPLISCFVAAVDGDGNPIVNLNQSNFSLWEDNGGISNFSVLSSGGQNLDASIGLVLDNSGSISDSDLQQINNAALGLINLLQPNDRASVFKFTEHVELLQNFTSNKQALDYAATSPRISGNMTALFDGIYDAISLTKLERARKAVVVLTDGIENSSKHSNINEVIEYAIENQIPVFTIGLGGSVNENNLINIAESTGGLYFASATTQNLAAIFESIGGTIDNQYEIQYTTPKTDEDCSQRTTRVQVSYNNFSDQKSRSYFAPCEGEIRIELPKDIPCFPGNSIVLQIIIEDVTGAGIYSYQFNLQYDPNVLTATGARSSGTLTQPWGAPVTSYPNNSQIRVGGYGVNPLGGAGVLVEVLFDVVGQNGEYSPLTFLEFLFNAGNPPAKLIDGFVWVTALDVAGQARYYGSNLPIPRVNIRIQPSGHAVLTDSQGGYLHSNLARGANYTTEATKTADTDIGPMSILTHDAAFAAQAAFNMRTLNQFEEIAADVDQNGQVQMYDASLIARYAVDLPKTNDSHVGEWQFEEPQHMYQPLEGNMKNQNFTGILLGDVTDNWSLTSTTLAKSSNKDIYRLFEEKSSSEMTLNFDPFVEEELMSLDLSFALDAAEVSINRIEWARAFDGWQTYSNYKDGIMHLGAFSLQKEKPNNHFVKIYFEDGNDLFKVDRISRFAINGRVLALQTSVEASNSIPSSYKLEQNYPNPFNPSTIISYSLEKAGQTEIHIFNSLGQKVRTLQNTWLQAGVYKQVWDACDEIGEPISPGIYFVQMSSGNFSETRKMVYVQ